MHRALILVLAFTCALRLSAAVAVSGVDATTTPATPYFVVVYDKPDPVNGSIVQAAVVTVANPAIMDGTHFGGVSLLAAPILNARNPDVSDDGKYLIYEKIGAGSPPQVTIEARSLSFSPGSISVGAIIPISDGGHLYCKNPAIASAPIGAAAKYAYGYVGFDQNDQLWRACGATGAVGAISAGGTNLQLKDGTIQCLSKVAGTTIRQWVKLSDAPAAVMGDCEDITALVDPATNVGYIAFTGKAPIEGKLAINKQTATGYTFYSTYKYDSEDNLFAVHSLAGDEQLQQVWFINFDDAKSNPAAVPFCASQRDRIGSHAHTGWFGDCFRPHLMAVPNTVLGGNDVYVSWDSAYPNYPINVMKWNETGSASKMHVVTDRLADNAPKGDDANGSLDVWVKVLTHGDPTYPDADRGDPQDLYIRVLWAVTRHDRGAGFGGRLGLRPTGELACAYLSTQSHNGSARTWPTAIYDASVLYAPTLVDHDRNLATPDVPAENDTEGSGRQTSDERFPGEGYTTVRSSVMAPAVPEVTIVQIDPVDPAQTLITVNCDNGVDNIKLADVSMNNGEYSVVFTASPEPGLLNQRMSIVNVNNITPLTQNIKVNFNSSAILGGGPIGPGGLAVRIERANTILTYSAVGVDMSPDAAYTVTATGGRVSMTDAGGGTLPMVAIDDAEIPFVYVRKNQP